MHDALGAFADLGIADMDGGFVDRDDFIELVGDILHAVGAERILRPQRPTGGLQILPGIPLIGGVGDPERL